MTGDVTLAGFLLTSAEWLALDASTRAELMQAAAVHAPVEATLAEGSGSTERVIEIEVA